jgi:Mechanosensitive ion channel, conserved TM helix
MADQSPLADFLRQFSAFLPSLAAGALVLVLGVVAGWLVKRALVQLLVWLRLDRLSGRSAWRSAFGKGDVRATLYDALGTIAMALTILLFAEDALKRWGLSAISDFVAGLLAYLPNLVVAGLIAGAGAAVANVLGGRVERTLAEEGLVHARLLAKSFKSALLAVVGALALWQLQFARQVVLSGFLILFGAFGVAFALAVGLGSAKAIQKSWESLLERRRRDAE